MLKEENMSDHRDLQTRGHGPDWIMVVMGIALVAVVVMGYLNSTMVPKPDAANPSAATQPSSATSSAPTTTTP